MATIIHRKLADTFLNTALRIIIPVWLIVLPQHILSQDAPGRKRVEILWTDEMTSDQIAGRSRQKLIGHVSLKHNNMFMTCDSAWYYDDTNQIYAFSKIHIHQGDTIHIYGRYLAYNGDTGDAVMTDSVEMIDKETHLFTRQIDYNTNTQIAIYKDGGRILNGENTLTSITGIYYSNKKMMQFRDSVKIVNPDYVMTSDTMRYDTRDEIVWFVGPTEAVGDSIYLYCENGWSNTKDDVSRLMKNAVLDNREQRITGDTLWYDEKKGFGEAFGKVTISDTTDNVLGGGDYAWYFKDPERFLLTGKAYFTMFSEDDTITLRADTLRASPQADTAGISHRLLKAYYSCTIFSREMQGKCDSLSYSFRDSVIRLYDDPVVWSRENQLSSDSISLFTRNRKADHMELYNSAFVVSCVDSSRFNQIKGKNLSGFFRDNKLYRIIVNGNGETIYYVLDGEDLVGVNKAKSASIEIFVEDGKIIEIYQNQSPEGSLDPPLKNPDEQMRLDGFRWLPQLRPDRHEAPDLDAENQKPVDSGQAPVIERKKPERIKQDQKSEAPKPKKINKKAENF